MAIIMYIAGALSFAFGVFATRSIVSDIQIGLAAMGFIGAFTLVGLGSIIGHLQRRDSNQ